MGKIDAVPDVRHIGEDVEHMSTELLFSRRRTRDCRPGWSFGIDVMDVPASVGTSSDVAAGADCGALRIVADREEETSDWLVLRDPLPEFDWALARTITSPRSRLTPATSSHAQA